MHYFNPRSPRGERRTIDYIIGDFKLFQSTLPSRGATLDKGLFLVIIHISIHAPLAGSDYMTVLCPLMIIISIHAPLAGSDLALFSSGTVSSIFQSTLPSRGATETITGTDSRVSISIHAPLAGSDSETNKYYLLFRDKNSMFPAICTAKSIKPSLKPRFQARYVHFFQCESFCHFMISSRSR